MFPCLQGQSGYKHKRLRKAAATIAWLTGRLAALTTVSGDVCVGRGLDPGGVPVDQGDHETLRGGWLGAVRLLRASHSRFFWALHLVCTLHGPPLGWALVGAKSDERDVLEALPATTPALARPKVSAGPSSPTGPTRQRVRTPPWATPSPANLLISAQSSKVIISIVQVFTSTVETVQFSNVSDSQAH